MRVTAKTRTIPAARRQRMLRCMALGLEDVSHASDGVDEVRLAVRVQLLAQVAHVDLDRVRLNIEIISPDLLEERFLVHYLPGVPRQVFQELEFAGGQGYVTCSAGDLAAGGLHYQVAYPQHFARAVPAAVPPAERHVDASKEF